MPTMAPARYCPSIDPSDFTDPKGRTRPSAVAVQYPVVGPWTAVTSAATLVRTSGSSG